MVAVTPVSVKEMKFPLSHPPEDFRLTKDELRDRVGDNFVKCDGSVSLVDVWKEAQSRLSLVAGFAERQMSYHDNDYGAVGKYDRCTVPGIMEIREKRNDFDVHLDGRSQKVQLPTRWYEKKQFATVVTDLSLTDYRHDNGALAFQRDYGAAYSNDKFPCKIWEKATVSSASTTEYCQIEANYRDDTLIVRMGKLP